MISHSHKFLFIQIPKTATSSIHSVLAQHMEYDYSKISRHAKYSEAAEFYPESKNYFKFSFVRNPWDRLLSFYLFKKTDRANMKIPDDLSLKDFILTATGQTKLNQHSYIERFDTFSFIGRFENLQDDFDKICDTIGVSSCKLPLKNTTKHNHYTEYYDNETRRIVSEKYAKDIEYFNYKFGE
jgi:chondroitin 4-sulfotransferase 11